MDGDEISYLFWLTQPTLFFSKLRYRQACVCVFSPEELWLTCFYHNSLGYQYHTSHSEPRKRRIIAVLLPCLREFKATWIVEPTRPQYLGMQTVKLSTGVNCKIEAKAPAASSEREKDTHNSHDYLHKYTYPHRICSTILEIRLAFCFFICGCARIRIINVM